MCYIYSERQQSRPAMLKVQKMCTWKFSRKQDGHGQKPHAALCALLERRRETSSRLQVLRV